MDRDQEQARLDAIAEAAAGWALRLDAPDASEADWSALQAWLGAAPEHRTAFDRAERVLAELTAAAPALATAYAARPPVPPVAAEVQPRRRRAVDRRARGRGPERLWRPAAGLAAAAAAALAVFATVRPPAPPAPGEVFQTAKGEDRPIALADGSRIQLNSGSRIVVRLGRDTRSVQLPEGEAAFDVAKDPTRPFLIAVGERTIRVVGTEFDVLRHNGRLQVTVRQGLVAVQAGQAEPVLLKAGDQYEQRAGDRAASIRRVDADAAFAWRQGELIYRDQSLAEVVDDLNRYFTVPVSVVGPAADLRFSGVLKIDDEDQVLRRLQGIFHVSVERRPEGTVLRGEPPRG